MNRFIVFLILLLSAYEVMGQSYTARNQEHETTVAVPDAMGRLLHKLAPGVDSIDWQQQSDGKGDYFEVYFRQGYQEGSITFEPDNSIEDYSIAARMDTLPLAVRQAIARKMTGHFWSSPSPVAVITYQFQKCALIRHPT